MSSNFATEDRLRCSFCGKPPGVVGQLISSGPSLARAYICEMCVDYCIAVLEDRHRRQASEMPLNNIKRGPAKILQFPSRKSAAAAKSAAQKL
jgi:ATP-dependent protease Clp ATPase subunit